MSVFDGKDKALTAEEKIIRAKTQMFEKSPFFSYILLRMMRFKELKRNPIQEAMGWQNTMGIDNKGNISWDREFVDKISDDELAGVIVHEVMHSVLMHMERRGVRNKQIFNIANDIKINLIVLENNFTIPKCGLNPDVEKKSIEMKEINHTIEQIDEKSSEEIYDEIYPLLPPPKKILIKMPSSQTGEGDGEEGNGQGEEDEEKYDEVYEMPKGFDTHEYGDEKGEDKESQSEHRARMNEWKGVIADAAANAKKQGKLPAGLARLVDELLESKISWKEKLYKYVVAQIMFDFSYRRPSKKSIATGCYMPSILRESIQIVVSIDTSGSIGTEELQEFLSELKAIGDNFPQIKLDIIICDAQVHETYQLNQSNIDDILTMKMSGGGGTDHIPIYNFVDEELKDCRVLINFTDGFTSFPKEGANKPYDSLWVICKNGCGEEDIPFGEVIKLK